MDAQEVSKLDGYLKKLFGNQRVRVVTKGDATAEVFMGEQDLGEITIDDEDGDLSYNFRMVIDLGAQTDLEPAPILAPLRTTAPMPTSELSPMLQPCSRLVRS